MKKLLGILVIGLCGITSIKLVAREIKQDLTSMNEEKSRQLWKIIQEAGDYLLG